MSMSPIPSVTTAAGRNANAASRGTVAENASATPMSITTADRTGAARRGHCGSLSGLMLALIACTVSVPRVNVENHTALAVEASEVVTPLEIAIGNREVANAAATTSSACMALSRPPSAAGINRAARAPGTSAANRASRGAAIMAKRPAAPRPSASTKARRRARTASNCLSRLPRVPVRIAMGSFSRKPNVTANAKATAASVGRPRAKPVMIGNPTSAYAPCSRGKRLLLDGTDVFVGLGWPAGNIARAVDRLRPGRLAGRQHGKHLFLVYMPASYDSFELDRGLLERVLSKLGLPDIPPLDLEGLNHLYAAVSANIPNDNIQKRIWLTGSRSTPVTGGNPTEFFNNWLDHGTGGTCWAINGAMAALAEAVGFETRRITGSMLVDAAARGANHGSVIVTVDGVEYLVDAQIAAYEVLPLIPGKVSRAGLYLQELAATPHEQGYDIQFWPGHRRNSRTTFRTEPEYDPVDQEFFVRHYARSAASDEYSPFNRKLYICRHYADRTLSIWRGDRVVVAADGAITSTPLHGDERRQVLVEELGVSEEAATAVPPDDPAE